MHVTADISITPVGAETSVSDYIDKCEEIIEKAGLNSHVHAFGTNVEGDWASVVDTVKECLFEVHKSGVPRILTTVRLDTRTDRIQSMEEKSKV